MKRAALYVRVSTEEQKKHGLSVDSQIVALRQYCKDNDLVEVDLYNDAGISARKKYTKRPELLRLMADCDAGRVDVIIFTKLDRWFRSVGDYYEVQKCLDKNKVTWRTIWEDYETETSSGVFKVNIMLSVAQSEADRTSERIKSVNEYKRLQGHYVGGKAPTGYLMQKNDLIIDESKRDAVRSFFDTYLSTFNVASAAVSMRSHGVTICRDTALRMLKNETYKGNANGYKCEAYITDAEWGIIQNSLATRRVVHPDREKRVYYFTGGLFRCAKCGGIMTGTVRHLQSGKNKRAYKYYRCTRGRNMMCDNHSTISERIVETYLLDHIDDIMREYNQTVELNTKDDNTADFEISKLESKLKRIGDRYEDGDIDREEYRAKRDAIQSQIAEIRAHNVKHEKKALPDGWKEVYKDLDASHRRAFWYRICDRIEWDPDAGINVNFN